MYDVNYKYVSYFKMYKPCVLSDTFYRNSLQINTQMQLLCVCILNNIHGNNFNIDLYKTKPIYGGDALQKLFLLTSVDNYFENCSAIPSLIINNECGKTTNKEFNTHRPFG